MGWHWYHICVSDLANCFCWKQRNWWIRRKHCSEPFAFDLGSCFYPKPTIKEKCLNLVIDTDCKRGAQSSNHGRFSRFSFLKWHLCWMWCTLVLTQKFGGKMCSLLSALQLAKMKSDECASDNQSWRLSPAWQTLCAVATRPHGWLCFPCLYAPSLSPVPDGRNVYTTK